MGLSASQARFLQLTARRSNIEYQAQQINFQRLAMSDKLSIASSEYQEKVSNRNLVFSYNNGQGIQKVDLSYENYKNYINQQMEGVSSAHDKYYLVSSSGNKIIVASEEEKQKMIEENTIYTPLTTTPQVTIDENGQEVQPEITIRQNDEGDEAQYLVNRKFTDSDFLVVPDLDDVDNFQNAIKEGIYYFAKLGVNENTGEQQFKTESWETMGAGAILDELNKVDDAQAEAEYEALQTKIQNIDKKLELKLEQLETERSAIQTEIESIEKVIQDNIDSSFKTFNG